MIKSLFGLSFPILRSFTGCGLLICCGILRAHAQAGPPLPAGKIDSIPANLDKQMKQAGKQQVDSVLGIVKSPLAQLQQPVKLFEGSKPVAISKIGVTAQYAYFQDTSGMALGAFQEMTGTMGYNADYGVALSGMPFTMSIRENNGVNSLNYTPFQNFYQFNFNHQQYLQTLRDKLLQKLSPEALMNSALRRVNIIRNNYETELNGEVTRMQQEYAKNYKSTVTVPAGATNLSSSDMGALQTQLMPADSIRKYQKEMARLQDMINQRNSAGSTPNASAGGAQGAAGRDSAFQTTLANVKRYETMEQIYNKIVAYRKKFMRNPLVKQLLSQSSYSPGAMKTYLSNPNNLSQVLDDQASLSAMQRLFVNIKQLNLGQNAVQSGELNVQNVVNTGANTEFQNRTTSVGVISGQNNTVNNWQQAGLSSQVTQYTNLTGFTLGSGTGGPVKESISCDFFQLNHAPSGASETGSSPLPVAPHQDGAITLNTGFQFSPQQTVTLDLSKSFGSYQNSGTNDAGTGIGKLPSGGSVFNGAGRANYAAILTYTGNILKTDIKLYARKVGLGYNDPGNPLLHSGETELRLSLARKLLKKKLTLKSEGGYRRQVFDPYGNFVYTAWSGKLQAGYKIDKYDKVNLTYQRSDYQSDFYGQPPAFGLSTRLQLDGTYRFILDGNKVMNNITISRQQTDIPFTTGGNYLDKSLLITNTSTFTVNKNPLSITILSNTSDNSSYYFNTSMFSTEANYAYALPGWPRMSSGLGYYYNEGWNVQAGIRQQVSAIIQKKISLDIQVSYKKAIEVIQTSLANQLFVNTTAHYAF
jgi:hypothetical protein